VTNGRHNAATCLEVCPKSEMRLLLVKSDRLHILINFIEEKFAWIFLILNHIYTTYKEIVISASPKKVARIMRNK
jgi:hypothetical protein